MAKRAAIEYLQETMVLTDQDLGTLGKSLDELMRDTPMMQVAAVRIRKIVQKSGPVATEGLKAVIFNLLSSVAQKALFG
jgi:hypothetical protein